MDRFRNKSDASIEIAAVRSACMIATCRKNPPLPHIAAGETGRVIWRKNRMKSGLKNDTARKMRTASLIRISRMLAAADNFISRYFIETIILTICRIGFETSSIDNDSAANQRRTVLVGTDRFADGDRIARPIRYHRQAVKREGKEKSPIANVIITPRACRWGTFLMNTPLTVP